jgi:hypothetical protein
MRANSMLQQTAADTENLSSRETQTLLPPDDAASNRSDYLSDPHLLTIEIPIPPRLERQTSQEGERSPRLAEAATHPPDDKLTDQDRLNFYGRWIENARFLGGFIALLVATLVPSEGVDYDAQFDAMVDKIGGVIIGTGMHFAFKNFYRKVRSLNPLYRNFKTLATLGTELGLLLVDLQILPQLLATSVFALGIGVLAIPYWLYREYFLKTPLHLRNKHFKTGIEGWSKYAKTFLVFGMYVGEVIGTVMALVVRGDFLRNIALFGAIGSVITFAVGIVAVPLINKFFSGALITQKDVFRNNYVRSGITLGIALGSAIGFVIFPLLGPAVGMAIGAAFGSVIGGVVLGGFGYRITKYAQVNWHVKEDTDNSWDYATRNSSYLFGFLGAAIGFLFIPVPGGALMAAAIGSAVASAIGWGIGLFVIRQARRTSPEEHKATTLPWTQRIANGSMIGSIIGVSLGFCLGLIGGPAGAIMGATLGFSAGAIIGGLGYGLYDRKARELIIMFFQGRSCPPEVKLEETTSLLHSEPDAEKAEAVVELGHVEPASSASKIMRRLSVSESNGQYDEVTVERELSPSSLRFRGKPRTNGHSNGVNGHTNGANGHTNGMNGNSTPSMRRSHTTPLLTAMTEDEDGVAPVSASIKENGGKQPLNNRFFTTTQNLADLDDPKEGLDFNERGMRHGVAQA